MTARSPKPYLNTRKDTPVHFLGLPTLIRARGEDTNGEFGLVEQWGIAPDFATPYHTHHLEDESFYILEGEVAFVSDGKWSKAGPGDFIFGPRNIPHGFKIVGASPAKMLILSTPSGFERFVLEVSEPPETTPAEPDIPRLIALAAKFQIDIHGPLPEGPDEASA